MAVGDGTQLTAELAEALAATLTFGQRHLGPPKWEAGDPSEAAIELANTETLALPLASLISLGIRSQT